MREHTSLAENWPRLSFASYFRYRGWSSVIVTITWQCLDTVMVGYFSGLWRDPRREGRIYEVSSGLGNTTGHSPPAVYHVSCCSLITYKGGETAGKLEGPRQALAGRENPLVRVEMRSSEA